MIKKFALISPDTTISHVTIPSNPDLYTSGEMYGELLAIALPVGSDALDYVGKRRYLSNSFLDILTSPVIANKTTVSANELATIDLSNIPANSLLTVSGQEANINNMLLTSTSESLTFDTPGIYQILITNIAYFPFILTVEAN